MTYLIRLYKNEIKRIHVKILTRHWPTFSVNPCSFHFSSSSVTLKHTSDNPAWMEISDSASSHAGTAKLQCVTSLIVTGIVSFVLVERQGATIDGFVLRERNFASF